MTTIEFCPDAGATLTFAGHVMIGPSESITIMLKLQRVVFEAESVPVHVTIVLPIGNRVPEGGAHSTDAPEQLSVTVAAG